MRERGRVWGQYNEGENTENMKGGLGGQITV